jgi:hypothetical protein
MLVKYTCADLNTKDVRVGKGQRDHISKTCLHPGMQQGMLGRASRRDRGWWVQVQENIESNKICDLGQVPFPFWVLFFSSVTTEKVL